MRQVCRTLRKLDNSRRKGLDTMLTDEECRGFLKILGRRIRTIRKDKNLTMRDIRFPGLPAEFCARPPQVVQRQLSSDVCRA